MFVAPSARAGAPGVGAAWLAFAIVGTLPLFWFGLAGLADAWARPEFSHGPVIPVLSFYMFLREMKAVPPPAQPVTDRWPGVGVILFALALAALGNLVRIDHLVFYALIVWVAGLVLVSFGFRRGRVFWPAVLHLVFMLPLPQFLYWKVNTALQLVSSQIGVKLVAAAGVPVYLDGNVIDLGVYMLQVAEACSGLRYLFPIMSFTYVFAVLYRGPLWQKLVLLALAIPVAVMMNAVRIGIIGILVDRYGVAQAEGFLHVFEGWVVFLSCLAILFALAKAMQRIVGDILDLARFRAGSVRLQLRRFDACELAAGVIRSVAPLADQRGQRLVLDGCHPAPTVYGDHRRLEQALLNLVSNAQRFSPDGAEIRVAVWHDDDRVRWSLENFVGEVAHIVFPATPVWIAVQGRDPALAGPNHAVFFNRGDVFRRRRFNGHGDRNDFTGFRLVRRVELPGR